MIISINEEKAFEKKTLRIKTFNKVVREVNLLNLISLIKAW